MNFMSFKKKHRQQHSWVSAFETCLIIYNPASTQATRSMSYIEALRTVFTEDAVIFVPTSPEGKQANRALVTAQAEKLNSKTLIVVAGGDGTVNLVIDVLLHDKHLTPDMRQATVLPLWGGNANDLAHMLNGSPHTSRLKQILSSSERIYIHPLACEITDAQGPRTYTAICYASFGASAFAASRLEALRGMRPFFHTIGIAKFIHELGMVLRALQNAPLFTVEDAKTTRTIYDRVFLNGSRFAKISGTPLKLTDQKFFHIVVERKKLSSMAYHIVEFTRRHPEWYAVANTKVSFTLREPTWAQLDGEVMYLEAGTKVQIRSDEQAFYALSTQLAP
jgi:diacylglycerol kinase family enzyme